MQTTLVSGDIRELTLYSPPEYPGKLYESTHEFWTRLLQGTLFPPCHLTQFLLLGLDRPNRLQSSSRMVVALGKDPSLRPRDEWIPGNISN